MIERFTVLGCLHPLHALSNARDIRIYISYASLGRKHVASNSRQICLE